MSRLSIIETGEEHMNRCRFAVVFVCCSLLQLLAGVQGAVVVSLPQNDYTVEENSGISVCFRVTGTPNSSSIELLFHAVGGTATEGVDYTLSSNHTLELPFPLMTGTTIASEQCFSVFQLCEDDIPENNESFTISVSTPNTPSVFHQNNFTVTIIDNDRVDVSFTRGRYTVSEGEAVEICAETGASSERDFVELSITTITGTAINVDFYVSGVTFNQEDNQFRKCMTLTAVDDILPEQKEFFRIRVSSSDNLVNIQHSTVKIYITDNDPVRFSLAQSVYVVEEGETARVCLEAAENDLPLIRFHLIVLDLGGNATGGDYAVDSEQYHAVGISSSSESHEICFEVAANDDAVSEGTEIETFQLLLSTDVSWVMLDVPRETTVDIVILDNDVVEVEFEQSVYFKTEGVYPYLSLCLTVSGGVDHHPPPSLTINTNSRTAVGASDYEPSNHWFELPESSYCHQLRIFDDPQPEPEEFFDVCVTTESPLIHISTECVQVRIVDNDTPKVFWERLQYTVTEGQGQVAVCAKLRGTLGNEAQVRITATDITAIDSYDYIIKEEQQVFVFRPLSPKRQCRYVDVVADELMEKTEVLRLSLSYTNSSDVVLNISNPHTTVRIQDTSSGYGCAEGGILLNSGPSIPGDKENTSGLVELCNSRGKWESVCDTEWSLNDAATICRQAGFHRPAGEGVMSLESLQPAAATFTCTQTDTNLANCLGEKPVNDTCRHLLVACDGENPVTSSKSTPSPATEEFPTAETGSRLVRPAPNNSSQFPIMGVVVGVFSALLLVGVVTVVGCGLRSCTVEEEEIKVSDNSQ
ncbi:hypothetical protein GBAR_LOCUS11718 [Geodia barretti]|uniref:SRCR domain-containing protein n=1 Tax=Geodia barretti TaxID=519541 RepID=A0AA35WJJ9_GEOBA|nr:hypothetical protein GBAR_LOCUS11718 [Geodia barretti]